MIGKLITTFLCLTIMAQADGLASQKHRSKGIALFNKAYQTWDNAGFWNATKAFEKAAKADPHNATNHYWQGTAHFHRMLLLQKMDDKASQKAADAEMEDAIDALTTATDLDPENAEVHALLGTLFGMKINGSLLRGIRFGPSVQKHHEKAIEHGAKSPRVQYLIGAGLLHTAEDTSDYTEALKSLLLAEKLYESEIEAAQKPGAAWNQPRWGYDACLAFTGDAFEKIGKKQKAADYYQKALRVHPTSHKAKEGLKRLSESE